uniref:Uncharacterized protein n=1 Tax=Macrostomum lignano TaxID=282301 RepID=A0A1I8HEL7_9PLAT
MSVLKNAERWQQKCIAMAQSNGTQWPSTRAPAKFESNISRSMCRPAI